MGECVLLGRIGQGVRVHFCSNSASRKAPKVKYELMGVVEMSAQCVSATAIWTLSTLVRTLHRLGRLICMAQADQFEAILLCQSPEAPQPPLPKITTATKRSPHEEAT